MNDTLTYNQWTIIYASQQADTLSVT